jgi:hypothetical protein
MDANIISYLFSVSAYLYFFAGFVAYFFWFAAPELVANLPDSIADTLKRLAPSDFYGEPVAAEETTSAILRDVAVPVVDRRLLYFSYF